MLTVFKAKKIITMDPNYPAATHVAVKDGKILSVGSAEDVQGWGDYTLDETFADKVIMPGMVEGHCHLMAGAIWQFTYVGYQDRIDPDGQFWPGVKTIEEVQERLKEADAKLAEGEPLVAWGFDPIFLEGPRMTKSELDLVSTSRPMAVIHSNFHLMTVNSASLKLANYVADMGIDGIALGADGSPSGELQEMAAMFPIMRRLNINLRELGRASKSLRSFGQVCMRAGVTSAADLINDLPDEDVAEMTEVTSGRDYPIRLHSMLNAMSQSTEETRERALELRDKSTDKLILGGVKIVTDGSIQGFTARIRWPGHYNGAPNGIWNVAPKQLHELVDCLNAAGVQMHIHTNGDEAIEVALEALEAAKVKNNRPDVRHVLQHCQMADRAHFRKMKRLGVLANLFSNHIYYFGDKHSTMTIGPDRARRMDACRSASDMGVPYTIHSDAPVTPMAPLFTAWCAVNRITESGNILGEYEKISVPEALYAITLGAAYTLQMDHLIGSIEIGKWADFAVLEDDPETVDPMNLKDIKIWGTVLGGEKHQIP
ncbi:amidohydrolase [Sneathiella limimaris]|uniref:amidohydrolase n=1 Tax=Sneathiella limimaris TaxID=1964213 RepID=UPI0019D2130E|nr:amidohydrolase [Sneathiella limimaris]